MQSIAIESLAEIAALMATPQPGDQLEAAAIALTGEPGLARRAISWLPEAFGIVLASHIEPGIKLPTTFMAKNIEGEWVELPLALDPVFAQALRLATTVFHGGPREIFSALALASSVHAAVNNALNENAVLKGSKLQPIRMLGLSAEAYGGP